MLFKKDLSRETPMPALNLLHFLPIDLPNVANSRAHVVLSDKYTLNVSESGEEFENLETDSTAAKLVIDIGNVLLKPTKRERVFAGAIISSGGSIIHDSEINQVLKGDLSGFERDIAALNAEGALRVGSPIALGGYSNTYTVAADGALIFGGESGLSKTVSIKNDFSVASNCAFLITLLWNIMKKRQARARQYQALEVLQFTPAI